MSEPKCLSEFLRDAYRNDTYELKLRLFSVDNNAVSFYLHPIGKDGDTADYYVVGNLTFPAQGEALAKLRQSVERDRQRYGGEGWTPEG